jgi:Tfp pilus assembly protein PilF
MSFFVVASRLIAPVLFLVTSALWAQMPSNGSAPMATAKDPPDETSTNQSKGSQSDSRLMRQLQQALTLVKRGDRQAAMNLVVQLLEQHPSFAPAIKLKGMLLEEAGRKSEAAAAYEEALKYAPNDPDLLLELGIYKLNAGQKEEALQLLEHCVRILPNDADAQFYLAQAYHLNGRDEPALRAIRRSLKIEPDNAAVWQKYGELLCITGDCKAGLPWLLKARNADATLPLIEYDIALANYKLEDLAAAAPNAVRAAEAQPTNSAALELLADIETKLANWQEAKYAFERLLALKPNDVDSLLGLGQSELELKNYATAVEKLQLVLRLDPTRLLAHFYLSRAYAGMGKTKEAEHEATLHHLMMEQLTFGRSTESDQREYPIRDETYQLLAQHREQEALGLYQQRFRGTPATVADAYVFVGRVYLHGGNDGDALRCFRHALEIQPTVRGAHTYQGMLALRLGDLQTAENEFTTELKNDPSYQLAIAELGEIRYRQGQWSDAAEQLAKSKTSTPELLYMLSDSYFRIGKVADANLTAETVAAHGRNNPELMQQLNELLVRNGQKELAQRLLADHAPR